MIERLHWNRKDHGLKSRRGLKIIFQDQNAAPSNAAMIPFPFINLVCSIFQAIDIVVDLSGGMSGKVEPDDVPILPHKYVSTVCGWRLFLPII